MQEDDDDNDNDDKDEQSSDDEFVHTSTHTTNKGRKAAIQKSQSLTHTSKSKRNMTNGNKNTNSYRSSPMSRKRTNTKPIIQGIKSTNPKTIQNALQSFSNKVLNVSQNNNNDNVVNKRLQQSLFASLLHSYKPTKKNNTSASSASSNRVYYENDLYYTQPVTKYTKYLSQLAYELVDDFNTSNNPTRMHVKLLNLLFLSIGGTAKSMIVISGDNDDNDSNKNHDQSDDDGDNDNGQVVDDLDGLDSEDWNDIISNLVHDMRNTPLEYIPFSCDPHGALHWNAMQSNGGGKSSGTDKVVSERDVVVKKGNSSLILAVKEYRSIFEEFWYILGTVALMEGGMSNQQHEDDMDQEDDENFVSSDEEDESPSNSRKRTRKNTQTKSKKKAKQKKSSATTSTTRFDSDIVLGILSLINEFVAAGQPDVRAAATTAALFLLHSIVDRSAFVQERLEVTKRQYDAATGVKGRNAPGAKAQSLKHQMDSLERTLNDLEHIIETFFINAIFMHRYRDSNMYIRSSCLYALGRMTIIRPDFFMKDKYLKYFGWMLSDKAECVRIASLSGLHLPFQFKAKPTNDKLGNKIDLMAMERVIVKFLPRIVDSVIDIHESVQEVGMKMMLSLMRNGFLEELDEKEEGEKDLMTEEMWDQVNLMALEVDTSPVVRRDALYFIMEQLEDFDDSNDEEEDIDDLDVSNQKKKRKSLTSNISDRRLAQRLDAVASWAAHTLTTGKVPFEKIRIHLVDYLVQSLRSMPEHKSIVTNWTSMIRAITEDNIAMTSQGTSAGERADVAKQRVLVRMLVCAAKAEVESVDADFLYKFMDPDIITILKRNALTTIEESDVPKKKSVKESNNLQHEALSIALIKSLPSLMVQFKSDPSIIDSLVSLPRYFSKSFC